MSADPGIETTTHDTPGRSLGAFLRRMRDRAEPQPGHRTTRRRAAGLRREEVALAAGISVTWYTWLEQGRPVRVSHRTLRSIARALRLDAIERAHLLALADAASSPLRARLTEEASPMLRAMADGLSPHPVYIVNGLWDVLYANDAAKRVFGDFEARAGITDNVLRRLFLDVDWSDRFVDWDAVARSAVAQFRAATAGLVGWPRWTEFVARLADESASFRARWHDHDLAPALARDKVVRHPELGELPFVYASVAPDGEPADVRVILYTPADLLTAARLSLLRPNARSLDSHAQSLPTNRTSRRIGAPIDAPGPSDDVVGCQEAPIPAIE